MPIHHATAAKAEKAKITLTEEDTSEGPMFYAKDGRHTFAHPRAPLALEGALLNRMLRAEWKGFQLDYSIETGEWIATFKDEIVLKSEDREHCPSLADILEGADHLNIGPDADGDGDDEKEETAVSVVVPLEYKVRYAEAGHRDNCGDWLAQFMEGKFDLVDGETNKLSFDCDVFTDFLIANGVPMEGKWASLPESNSRGWQGRYRMNGRQRLERIVAERGTVIYRDEEYKVPAGDLDLLRKRHPLEKKEKPKKASKKKVSKKRAKK